jgi:hypothetical protein
VMQTLRRARASANNFASSITTVNTCFCALTLRHQKHLRLANPCGDTASGSEFSAAAG